MPGATWLPSVGNRPGSKHTHTHTHTFNGPLSGITQVSRYQKGKTNLNFTEARDSEWQWHQLGHMQVCTLIQTDNHASTPPLSFLQAGCPSCHPTNSVRALKAWQQTRVHECTSIYIFRVKALLSVSHERSILVFAHPLVESTIHKNYWVPFAKTSRFKRILLVQSITAQMRLLAATSAFRLGRRRWSSPQQRYLHCLCTIKL